MTMTFNKAPLVEVVAELKWGETLPQPMPAISMLLNNRSDYETLFVRLGAELYQHGFRRVERVIPPGFPILPFQPVYRYRGETGCDSVFYQAGPGMFAINAVPPYRSWENVEPYVSLGVKALLQTREPSDKQTPFNVLSLRYINGFGPDLTEGRDVGSFISEVFGFGLKFPESLAKHKRTGALIEPYLQLSVPLKGGASLAVLIAQGAINNESRLIVDLSITTGAPVAANEEDILTSFRNARNVIHDIFVDWTKPIHHLLQPVEDSRHAP